MIITQIQQTKRGRISVYVDGEFVFAVEQLAWQQCSLHQNDEVTEQQLTSLLESSNKLEAKRRALDLLSMRDYTSDTLTKKLAQKTDSSSAKQAVERMQELGLVDDEKYAVRYSQQLFDKGYGKRRILFELQKRRLPADAVSAALEQLDFSDDNQRALDILCRKFEVIKTEAEKRRAFSFLERCGYNYSDINYAIKEIFEPETQDF